MDYKVKKDVSEFRVELANNGFVIEYSGRNANDDWAADKIVVPNIERLFDEVNRIIEVKA